MSHFSQVKTHLKDTESIKKILRNAGFQVVEAPEGQSVEVRGFMGEKEKADFKILTKTHYDIGFRINQEGSCELVGDWDLMPWVADIEQNSFTQWLKREYAKDQILSTAQAMGYEVEQVEEDENGQIQLVVTKW